MIRFLMLAALLSSITFSTIGCGSPRSERPKVKASITESWEEGKAFFEEPLVSALYTIHSRNAWKEAKAVLTNPEFKAALDKFEAAELPSGFDSKKTPKDTIVTKYKAMIEEANGSADKKKLKALFEEASAAQKELVKTE